MKPYRSLAVATVLWTGAAVAAPAIAQAQDAKDSRRVRVSLGAKLEPGFPGARDVSLRPFVNVWLARGDEPFAFKAPDESFGLALVQTGDLAFGPVVGFQGSRTAKDVGANLSKVDFTVEAGGFAHYSISENFRVRAEVRKGINGHDGLVGNISADFVARQGDAWLFSIGPRVTITDRNYQNAYFGVSPDDSLRSGLARYSPGGGVQSVGAAAGYLMELSNRWGLNSFVKYDRLVNDAADSPIVTRLGRRDQLSGGLAVTYIFGGSR